MHHAAWGRASPREAAWHCAAAAAAAAAALAAGAPPALLLLPQGAQIMSQYGVNVPPGIPVFKLDEVAPAAKKMADDAGEVGAGTGGRRSAPPPGGLLRPGGQAAHMRRRASRCRAAARGSCDTEGGLPARPPGVASQTP